MTEQELQRELDQTNYLLDTVLDALAYDNQGLKYKNILTKAIDAKKDDVRFVIANEIAKWNYHEKLYQDEVKQTADLLKETLEAKYPNPTTRQKVNYVKNFIENYGFEYKHTDGSMWHFLQTKTGQCAHIANYFHDLCKALGVSSAIIHGKSHGENHVWNRVIVDEQEFYFDITWNISGGEEVDGKYAWMSLDEMSLDHREEFIIRP